MSITSGSGRGGGGAVIMSSLKICLIIKVKSQDI